MSGYTPGPWKVDNFGENKIYIGCDPIKNRPPPIADGRTFICKMYLDDNRGIDDVSNARLIASAPELLEAQTMGSQVNTPDFLDWMADRLINVYGESPNVDFVLSLRERANAGRAAIAKATGSV